TATRSSTLRRSSAADQGHERRGRPAGRRPRRRRRGAHAAAEGGRQARGALPLPRRAHAELLRQPGEGLLLLLRLRQGRRRLHLRARDAGPRLRRGRRVARRALPDPARVRAGVARRGRSPPPAAAPLRAARPGRDLLRAAPVGIPGGLVRPRLPRRPGAAGGGLPRVPARARAGRRPAHPQGAREGLHRRRAARRRPLAGARRRLLPAPAALPARRRARAGARVPGAPAPRRRPAARKYVNTPESELFRKGDVVYGLDRARDAILKEERACVVEGNTDVLALRQAGFRPVVACMGTALTEAQLRELGRLAKRLFLAFDGDEAGEAATLRGMELAVARGFEVNVVALPPLPDTPEKREAIRWASDRFGMAPQLPSVRATQAALSPRRVAAAIRRERAALAGVVAHPSLVPILAELPPHHFPDEASRAVRAHLVDGAPVEGEALGLLAELDA